jgi:hypothetical protein
LGQQVQAAQVGDVQADPVGDGLVEQDAVGGAGLGGALQLGQQFGPVPAGRGRLTLARRAGGTG